MCEEHSSSAPPRVQTTGSWVSAPECLSPACSLEAAWQGRVGRETAGVFEDAAASFTRGQLMGLK